MAVDEYDTRFNDSCLTLRETTVLQGTEKACLKQNLNSNLQNKE